MKDPVQKESKKDNGVSQVAAAIAGAVVGAGIAVAGVALTDDKNRKKVIKAATSAKNDVVGYVEHAREQAEEKKKEAERRMVSDKEKVRRVVDSAKNSLDKTTKEVNKAVKSL